MELKQIITCANEAVRLEFTVMERSLRATGCDLPLYVIPYDNHRFELPANAQWWGDESFVRELDRRGARGHSRKLLVLTTSNYQLIDCDAVFLTNPQTALANAGGFVATCTQWRLPQYTYTPETEPHLDRLSTTWRARVFNSGQFACEPQLYDVDELIAQFDDPIAGPLFMNQQGPYEQPAFNWLVAKKDPKFVNLTMPPLFMESTWAGDYDVCGEHFERYWQVPARKPMLIHYAGGALCHPRPINALFFEFLTADERRQWDERERAREVAKVEQMRLAAGPVRWAARRLRERVGSIAKAALPPAIVNGIRSARSVVTGS